MIKYYNYSNINSIATATGTSIINSTIVAFWDQKAKNERG